MGMVIVHTLIELAKVNGPNDYKYLAYLFRNLLNQ